MLSPPARLVARSRLVWHIAGSLKDFWSSDLNRATVGLVDPRPGELLVDLGAGLGPASVEAVGHIGLTGGVIAVDPSRTMRAVLRLRRLSHRGLRRIEIADGAAESLPVEAGSIDALWAVNATHHFTALDRFATELSRALRPGGRVVLVEEDLNHPDHPFTQAAGPGRHGPHAIDVDALLELFTGAGLTDATSVYRALAGVPATVITATKPA